MKTNDLVHNEIKVHPKVYAYELVDVKTHKGYIKVGYTTRDAKVRVREINHTSGLDYKIVGIWSAIRNDGSYFMDHDVHKVLKKKNISTLKEGEDKNEWFKCAVKDVEAAVIAVKNNSENVEDRNQSFRMRPEQERAVKRTEEYFLSSKAENKSRTPKFLWNAKMRFGKTFASYQLAKKMKMKRVLVLTFKPAVKSAWYEDLVSHVDFEGWQFICNPKSPHELSADEQFKKADKNRPIVCFGSFQDFLGINKGTGGIKAHNEWVHTTNWDLVIFDEYHYGAWRDNAKKLFEMDEDLYDDYEFNNSGNNYNESWLPITTRFYLYLSGTPFRALNSGEFIEEQVYNWTYSDEQYAKAHWNDTHPTSEENPYQALPQLLMFTYKLPDSIQNIAKNCEFNEFDLNTFFKAEGKENSAKFIYEDYVQKWLDLIRGAYLETSVTDLKLGAEKPPMPFVDSTLLSSLNHTVWFLPDVSSCYAMANLLKKKNNTFYKDYKVNVCAGTKAGIGDAALTKVLASMEEPTSCKTITLSCGKLMTGVTVKPWSGIFMLRNLSSPESYFQAAFRVQSPWVIKNEFNQKVILKNQCFIFDFAINRALKQISDYSCRLNSSDNNPENKVKDFISFLPVIAYDGSSMRKVNASEILDYAMSGTSATLLARRWESALLVNVDNDTLNRLLDNEDAMNALMKIEGFRNLNKDLETIISKSESVKNLRKTQDSLSKKEKEKLSKDEKDYKEKRKQIQEKLIKFATRIPIFMYLTDYREVCLQDVITDLEPNLFKKVTGLTVKDFELLVSLNLFNESLMNEAVFNFKRYEDASLTYTGIDKHENEDVGLYNTVINKKSYDELSKDY